VLIPLMGAVGAAAGLLAGQALNGLLGAHAVLQRLGLRVWVGLG
jgi:hypothetical protein